MRKENGFGAGGQDVADTLGPFEKNEGIFFLYHFLPAEIKEVFGLDAVGVDVVDGV